MQPIGSVEQVSIYIKVDVQPKMNLKNWEILVWKERGRGEREREGQAGRQAGGQVSIQSVIFKVRFGRDREIEGRDRDTEI
jgi:hypothetical protein